MDRVTAATTQAGRLDRAVPELRVEKITVQFAGVRALSDVSFTVEPGTIHALIGPNGAGKSTCFNVISGVYRANQGRVMLGEHDLTLLRPHDIAGLGVGRAFQNIALSAHLSVRNNILLGRHHLMRTGFLAAGLRLPRAVTEERRHLARVAEIAEFLELGDQLDQPAGALSYGGQKRVEMARSLAMEPTVLLLDEPVAGMNAEEIRRMAALISDVRDALDISILLVEHDMGMVMGISDRVTVLDFGRLIADGPPAQVQNDEDVIRAYLGTEAGPADAAVPTGQPEGTT
ncbi:MAG: ABC transporter ATP-binding protein [Pseudonocardiales bacterium]